VATPVSGPASVRSGRVLLAEDEEPLRAVFEEVLADAGHQVVCAPDGRAALHALEGAPFDVVVSDIRMPGFTGLQLLRAVRERDLDVPVILMTGSPTMDTAVRALEDGALKYLVKPFHTSELVAAVAHAVQLGRMARLKREALAHLGFDDRQVGDRAGLEATFASALGSLAMAYQPIVHATGAVFGHEALLRSREPALPHPGAVLDAAERLGRVHEVGRAVRRQVAERVAAGAITTAFVNLHSHDLLDGDLLDPATPLSAHADRVVLEITERATLDGIPDLRGRISTLRDRGFRIAVDDLGAGYAGLTSFAALEPDIVKLDMSLIRGVHEAPIKQKLVGSMAAVCRELGIKVVAEGIETEAERAAVVDLGCDLLQGFLIGRPAELP
jgi:EAL domain-containing protein (putative c-di-GMP-specific phosphodiesterase class I)/CheY-like chemotaxis protein